MPAGQSYEEYAAGVEGLIAAGDLEALANHLADTARQHYVPRTNDLAILAVLAALPKPAVLRLFLAMIAVMDRHAGDVRALRRIGTLDALTRGLGGWLPARLSDEEAADLLAATVRHPHTLPAGRIVALVGWHRGRGEMSARVLELVHTRAADSKRLRLIASELSDLRISPGEPWSDRILAELPGLDPVWSRIVAHAGTALGARPSAVWTKRAADLLSTVNPDRAHGILAQWLGAVTTRPTRTYTRWQPDINGDTLLGLIWMLPLTPVRPGTVRLLGALTEAMLRRLPGIGPACPKLANATVFALSRIEGEAALAQLARLSSAVTYKATRKEIVKALDARAGQLDVTRDEVEELAVPGYGLTEVGRRTVALGSCAAELSVRGTTVAVTWRAASGRQVKRPPAEVRRDHPGALADLTSTARDVSGMLSAQVARLDALLLARRAWPLLSWRERYLDHPVVGTLARRLIWLVDGVPCAYAGGALRTLDDAEVGAPEPARVELWHPIDRPVAEVVAWRDWLERHEIVQPFKQAHREVYRLTPAERATGVYSNRFAGHILRQHQFHALAVARRWTDKLRLMVDDSFPPARRELPQWGVRAEFWVEGSGHEHGIDTTDAGTYLQLATDQVRFYPLDAGENRARGGGGPVPLEQIPALLLSEIMRDVDLFVGVASVGNDPTWSDGGPDGRYRDYWTSYSFGELSATAHTRRDLLTRLLPRLAIGARAAVDGRFLVVRGDLHTYKIHLGSGNILMSPGDSYLCIVPDPDPDERADVRLPFEGDGMLAVILSKAILLAGDGEITDPTITAQIGTAG
jgi:hypothetical protein